MGKEYVVTLDHVAYNTTEKAPAERKDARVSDASRGDVITLADYEAERLLGLGAIREKGDDEAVPASEPPSPTSPESAIPTMRDPNWQASHADAVSGDAMTISASEYEKLLEDAGRDDELEAFRALREIDGSGSVSEESDSEAKLAKMKLADLSKVAEKVGVVTEPGETKQSLAGKLAAQGVDSDSAKALLAENDQS